jgi:hypothetical protein
LDRRVAPEAAPDRLAERLRDCGRIEAMDAELHQHDISRSDVQHARGMELTSYRRILVTRGVRRQLELAF